MTMTAHVVTDNGANFLKAVGDCGFRPFSYFADTLNLVVEGSIIKTIEINSLFQKFHGCVTYYKRRTSILAKGTLCKTCSNDGI